MKWYQTSFLSSMQEFPTKPDWFSITDCITTIILESFFNLFYLSTLAIGPAMHFRPILLLHWPPPLCTSEWHHWVHSDARAVLTFTGAGADWSVSTSTAQRSGDCEKVFPSLFMVIRFGSTCFRSVSVSVGRRGMKGKSIFCYVHILSVSDVDEFNFGAEPERSVDQRARLRGWPMCDTCL